MSRKYYSSSFYTTGTGMFILVFWIFIGCLFIGNLYRSFSIGTGELEYKVVTVTDKTVKRGVSAKTDLYLIYTKDENGDVNVFQISDSILAWRFDSSDAYGGIEIGQTYKFGYRGKRVPILSWYPNVYFYELVEEVIV